jgi:hypothetical protein
MSSDIENAVGPGEPTPVSEPPASAEPPPSLQNDPPLVPPPTTAVSGTPTRRRLRIALIVLLTYSALTGGVYVNDRTHIQADRTAQSTVHIGVLYDFDETHVPLLFHYAAYKRPYRLTMSVSDPHKAFDRIEIDEIVIELEGGETLRGMQNWGRDFREADWGLSALYGDVAMYSVSQILDVSVPRAEPFSLTLKGRLRSKAGELIPLNHKVDYRVYRQWYVFPYWLVLYGRRWV